MRRAELFSEPANVIETGRSSSATEPLKLHLGCGNQRIAGYVNCDLYETTATDKVFDCTSLWPFDSNSVSTIYCSHMLEHLVDFRAFFREAHRVLRPDGNLQVRVPYGGHNAAYWDVTHVRPWYAETFCFLQPGYSQSIGNHQHDEWTHYFSVDDCVLRVTDRLTWILRWKLGRMLLLPWLDMMHNAVEEMWVYLVPLKTEQQIAQWMILNPGNAVAARYSAYRHHVERRQLGANEVSEFVDWRKELRWNGFHAWWNAK